MELINRDRPVLLLHPSHDSSTLNDAAITLTNELTELIRHVEFEDALLKDIKRTINLCRRGIERVMSLEGKVTILSADSIKAERVLNDSLETLAKAMNDGALEMKKRAMTEPDNPEAFYSYAELLDQLITTTLSWSQNKSVEANEGNITLIFDDED